MPAVGARRRRWQLRFEAVVRLSAPSPSLNIGPDRPLDGRRTYRDPSPLPLTTSPPETPSGRVVSAPPPARRSWPRALRLHHWSKNLLVFAPALLAHRPSFGKDLALSSIAFVAFCLVASATYLINDRFDRP